MAQLKLTRLPQWIQDAENAPEQEWLIDGMVPAGAITLIAGRPKLGRKSFLAQLITLIVASGKGCPGLAAPGKGLPVIYIEREGTLKPTARRFKMLSETNEVPLDDNLYMGFNVPFKMDSAQCVSDLLETIQALGVKLVVIDTLAKSMSGDENSARDMGEALLCAERVKELGCAVIIVHHLNKGARLQPGEQMDPAHGLRGSSALEGAYDMMLSVQQATVEGERNTYLVRGGKFTEFEAAVIDWDLRSDSRRRLIHAKMAIGDFGDLPVQDESQSNSKAAKFPKKI